MALACRKLRTLLFWSLSMFPVRSLSSPDSGECHVMRITSRACQPVSPPSSSLDPLVTPSCPPPPGPCPAQHDTLLGDQATSSRQLSTSSPHSGSLCASTICDVIHKLGWTEVVIAADPWLPAGLGTDLVHCLSELLVDAVSLTVEDATSLRSLSSLLAALPPDSPDTQALLMCASVNSSVPGLKDVERTESNVVSLSDCDHWWSSCTEGVKVALRPLRQAQDWNPRLPQQLSSPFNRSPRGTKLTVATLEAPPFVTNASSGNVTSYEGLCIDLLNAIARELNFTYVITSPSDGMYGAPGPDDTWNGMVGMVKRGEADLAIGPFTITSLRNTVVDFTVPYMEDGGGILSRKTPPRPDLLRVFSPFTTEVWLATGGMLVAFGMALFLVNKYSAPGTGGVFSQDVGYSRKGGVRGETASQTGAGRAQGSAEEGRWTLATSMWTIFSSFMEEGAAQHPTRTSARLVLGCWWIFTLLLLSIYTATLAAMLTVIKHPDLIDSLEDVAASDLQPLTVAGTNWDTMFRTANSGVYKEIGQRLKEGPVLKTREEVLGYVSSGQGVFLYDISQVDFLYRQDCQNLHLARRVFNANGLGFVLPQNGSFRRAFNKIILQLQEGGILHQWRKRWWGGGQGGCSSEDQGNTLGQGKQLAVTSVAGIFLVYATALFLAVLAFSLSSIHRKIKSTRFANIGPREFLGQRGFLR